VASGSGAVATATGAVGSAVLGTGAGVTSDSAELSDELDGVSAVEGSGAVSADGAMADTSAGDFSSSADAGGASPATDISSVARAGISTRSNASVGGAVSVGCGRNGGGIVRSEGTAATSSWVARNSAAAPSPKIRTDAASTMVATKKRKPGSMEPCPAFAHGLRRASNWKQTENAGLYAEHDLRARWTSNQAPEDHGRGGTPRKKGRLWAVRTVLMQQPSENMKARKNVSVSEGVFRYWS
jgi:hypothetical protein